jgi:3D (Asp-Asp-Asp) domain-containing protein
MKWLLLAIVIMVSFAGMTLGQDNFELKSQDLTTPQPKSLWATHYYIHSTPEATEGMPLKDVKGNIISADISLRDWCLSAIEGTVTIRSKSGQKTFNYAGVKGVPQVDCVRVLRLDSIKKPWAKALGRSRYTISAGVFGQGVRSYKLVPYRSIAVDPKFISYGSVIYIPEARGAEITMPDGRVLNHDGYFFAADTGGAIKLNHIDVFCGLESKNCFRKFIHSTEKKTFSGYIVNDQEIADYLAKLHK